MATWVEVKLLRSDEPALINVDAIQYVRPSLGDSDATEVIFTGDRTVDIAESYQRVCDTLKARSHA